MSKATYIDRNEASEILKVSTRTIDRYIRKYKIKPRKDGRKLLIKRTDLEKVVGEKLNQIIENKQKDLAKELKVDTPKKAEENKIVVRDIKINEIKEKNQKLKVEQEIYKELYKEVKGELKEKQERLEAATYRVGQLEAQAKNMVPLLDFNQKERALEEAETAISRKEVQLEETVGEIKEQLRVEKVAKWVYLSLVGFLLVVQPILFLLWAFN